MALYNGTVRLKGERISLCAYRSDNDAVNQYITWLNDERINHWFGLNSRIYTFDEEKDFCTKRDLDNMRFLIMLNSSKQIIGNCAVHITTGHYRQYARRAGMGILIGEYEHLGQGYGTEAMKMLVKFSFEELNMNSVYLHVMAENKQAIRCYEKVGFKVCGIEHEAAFIHGNYMDVLTMEILRRDYGGIK